MNKKTIAIFAALLAPVAMQAAITLTFNGGAVFDSNGVAVADGGLMVAVTSPGSTVSSPSSVFEAVEQGKLFGGNDVIIGTWSVNSAVGAPGAFDATFAGLSLGNGIATGQRIAIYWFPTLDSLDSVTAGGESYGFYSDPAWLVPADSATVTFAVETEAIGGPVSDSLTRATFLVPGSAIPEPSSFAALAGLGILGVVATRRRRSA